MRGAVTRHVTTVTGQTMVRSDYGADDLNKYRDDTPVADATASDDRVVTQIHALIDGDMPAVAHKTQSRTYNPAPNAGAIEYLADLHPAEAIRTYNKLREPDLYDTEQAIWVTNLGMVAVDLRCLRGFNAYCRANGLIPGGLPGTVRRQFYGEALPLWDFIKEVCCNDA